MEELLVCVSEGIFSVEEVCQAVNILSGFYEVKIEETPSYFSCFFFIAKSTLFHFLLRLEATDYFVCPHVRVCPFDIIIR